MSIHEFDLCKKHFHIHEKVFYEQFKDQDLSLWDDWDVKASLKSYYYCSCFYCALTDGVPHEEWDSKRELVERAFDVLELVDICIAFGIRQTVVDPKEVHFSMRGNYTGYCKAYEIIMKYRM